MSDRGRPAWDTTWMDVARTIGRRSWCTRAQVGAVVVTADNRVASTSYNGPAAGLGLSGPCTEWCPRGKGEVTANADYGSCATIHAEANGLLRANFTDIQGGTIYVSHSSCINCAKLVANSGLARLVHHVTEADMHRNPDQVEKYLRSAGLVVDRA